MACKSGMDHKFYRTIHRDRKSTTDPLLTSKSWDISLMKVQMCASIPATKKFFSRFSPRLFGASEASQQLSHARNTARYSYAGPPNVELGTFAGHGYADGKSSTFINAFPAPPRNSHAVSERTDSSVRPQTPKSSTSVWWDGMDDVTRVDSVDQLVDRYVSESLVSV